jgi:hypothetical protein
MVQWAPYPEVLEELVERLRYKPGWSFELVDHIRDREPTPEGTPWWHGTPVAGGLTFIVTTKHVDAYHPGTLRPVNHLFPVPAATYNRESWQRWLLNRLLDVDMHEACEWMVFAAPANDTLSRAAGIQVLEERPFAPTHGPGDDPYRVVQYATDEARRTLFTGEVNAR